MSELSLVRHVDRERPIRYAGAALDFNPIHLFDDAARAAGLRNGIILHGMCTLAWVADAIERAAGRPLVELSCRFARPVHVGELIYIEPHAAGDDYSARVHLHDGEEILRAVKARVGARPDLSAVGELPDGPRRDGTYRVSWEKIREFRSAIEVDGPPDVAPPTFIAVACQEPVFGLLDEPDLEITEGTIIHAAQHLRLRRRLRSGETVRTEAALIDDRTKGGLRRLLIRSITTDARGRLVTVADWTLLQRPEAAA